MLRRCVAAAGLLSVVVLLSAHVGSPDVFFTGKAGEYDIRVLVRPPEVVPGIARVTVRAPADVERVSIRPVFWRAGSKGAPAADEARQLQGQSHTFEGALWLMARGAYSVEVSVAGRRGAASVMVPVASLATGRLTMSAGLGAVLLVFGAVLCAGLITIVYKSAGESLVPVGVDMDAARRARARRVAALAIPILAVMVFGGARWWRAVDGDYQRTIYRPSPLGVTRAADTLRVSIADQVFAAGRPSPLTPDHGKLMHLFVIRDDAGAFAHLHPRALDSSTTPTFETRLPPLPAGTYRLYGDVVHETGLERTLVGSVTLDSAVASPRAGSRLADPDDAWYVGDASRDRSMRLADGSTMDLQLDPNGTVHAGREETIRVTVREASGAPARLETYLGMNGHGVVTRVDGTVYIHLHPMGTITTAAQLAFLARDRGDTTDSGRLKQNDHPAHIGAAADSSNVIEFPYAFPKGGSYRLFVQVKRGGRILTGAFAIPVAESPGSDR